MKKKIIVYVVHTNELNLMVKDSVTILANNLFTDGKLNEKGIEKMSKTFCGLWSKASPREQIHITLEDGRYDNASKDYINSSVQKEIVTSPVERLLIMILGKISPSIINSINMMNASVEESLSEINLEEEKGDNE